jgi:cytochrome d ubiquinol oxidase subunit I
MDPAALDSLTLARIQFAANISFHILFPTINIALGWVLLFFRLRQRVTGDVAWEKAYAFWVKIFALSFALGVVSGITMSFQFGTNWPGYMERAGNIAGPLLGYEVLTAFFLEATFLGVMLFGKDRVSERTHLIATFLVALGTTFSAFWILSLNSWMQTPVGHTIVAGKFHAVDWWRVIFNPSFPYRLTHMLLASFITCAFLIAGVSAWQHLKGVANAGTTKVLRTGILLAAMLLPVQIFVGDLHGLNTLKHQPAKVAAMEGLWETRKGAPLVMFAWPDKETRSNRYAIEIPKVTSFILTHELEGEVKGLNEFPGAHPPVAPVFWAFRVMVGMGVLMLVVSWAGAFFLWKKRAVPNMLLGVFATMTFGGWVATLAGWYVTEIGRQPWIIYGLVKTADVVAAHPPNLVAATLFGYLVVYVVLILAYVSVVKYLAEIPEKTEQRPEPEPPLAADAPKET